MKQLILILGLLLIMSCTKDEATLDCYECRVQSLTYETYIEDGITLGRYVWVESGTLNYCDKTAEEIELIEQEGTSVNSKVNCWIK